MFRLVYEKMFVDPTLFRATPHQPQGGQPQDGSDGAIDSAGAPIPQDTTSQARRDTRSLGDIMKDIRRRRDEIIAQQQRDAQTQPILEAGEVAEGSSQVEYLKEGDEGQDQALGPAGDEERQRLADLNIMDEDQQEDSATAPGIEEDDTADDGAKSGNAEERMESAKSDFTEQQKGPVEKALRGADVQHGVENGDDTMDVDDLDLEGINEKEEDLPPAQGAAADDDVIVELNDEPAPVSAKTSGEDAWRQYAAMTSDLSYALCEQLRLILDPTLATRLQGDFPNGQTTQYAENHPVHRLRIHKGQDLATSHSTLQAGIPSPSVSGRFEVHG